jgi:soluble lytic murein transglycosylase
VTFNRKRGVSAQVVGLVLAVCLTGLAGRFLILELYPLDYQDIIAANAKEQSVPAELIAAVIRVESGFDPDAVSHRDAMGLMQLTPETAAWMGRRLGLPLPDSLDLYNPETSIYIGTAYLAYLIDLFDGNLELALAAYNGGHANVSKWLEQGAWDGEIASLKNIPFWETRGFVNKVISSREIYRRVYRSQLKAD